MALICVFLVNAPFFARLGLFTFANLISIIPLFAMRPYKDWKMTVVEGITEVSFFFVCLVMLSSGGSAYGWRETIIYFISLLTGILV